MVGNPIPDLRRNNKPYFDHINEAGDTLRGLRKNAEALEGVTDPAAAKAWQDALDAIKELTEAIRGIGI